MVTLLGRNGAGKTTTLKSIMGIVGQRTGSVRFEGSELIGAASDRIARAGIAFCPEERGIFASLNVEENLLLPPQVRPGGLDARPHLRAVSRTSRSGCRSQGTKLSGGEQQMLAIGRILRTGARLLLLDEPTEGLAPVIIQQIGKTIRTLKAAGLHHPAGRAEFSLRLDGCGPLLRDGARPDHRPVRQFGARRQPGKAPRLSRSVNVAPVRQRHNKEDAI